MSGDPLEGARARIESAASKHAEFLREADRFVYLYVKGMLKGFEGGEVFKIQLSHPKDSYMTGRGRLLAVEIIEGVRSALDYVVYTLSLRNDPAMNPKYPKFVIADDKKAFDAQAKGAMKHLTDVERAFIEALQPFATQNDMLSLIRDAANKVKHRNLLTIEIMSSVEIVCGNMEQKGEYKDWWCYPQEKGAAVFARGELRVRMLGEYDAVRLLEYMVDTGGKIVGAVDQYLSLGKFPEIQSNNEA